LSLPWIFSNHVCASAVLRTSDRESKYKIALFKGILFGSLSSGKAPLLPCILQEKCMHYGRDPNPCLLRHMYIRFRDADQHPAPSGSYKMRFVDAVQLSCLVRQL
jgi:hypothetical protein